MDDHDISAASDISDDAAQCKVHLSALAVVVAWNDNGDHIRHTSHLYINIHVDTSDEQALFILKGSALLQDHQRPISLFLFVYPESIQSLEFESDAKPPASAVMNQGPHQRFGCLRFKLTQSPDFVGPKHPSLEQFEDLLDTMNALSLVQNFSIYLDMSLIPPGILRQISSLPSLFSPTSSCRPLKTDGPACKPQKPILWSRRPTYKLGRNYQSIECCCLCCHSRSRSSTGRDDTNQN
ncbi:hypothetical protein B0T20DRAFT_97120 [Sordaria brevicollis]|uniref:Uncharacterized protein n=1 Tax=Sordaria brevicollis TaxID=83679 RepID=A0AAE0NVP4_SORBR|nr:hypothetical protein B0T20DRAFT_97120 [Sordaria brevicollis]